MTNDTDTRPSIAELQQFDRQGVIEPVVDAHAVLLEIAAAAKRLESELQYLIGPESRRLQEAIARVRR